MLQLRRSPKVVPIDSKQRGKVHAGVLIRLDFEALPIPPDGVLQRLLVRVLRLDELVLVDAAAKAENVWHLVLLLLERFVDYPQRLLYVALPLAAVQGESVEEDDGGRARACSVAGERFEVFD